MRGAHYYLGNLLYDKSRREEAIGHWERACHLDPEFSIPWRNLGHRLLQCPPEAGPRALECYETACRANPSDARLLYEWINCARRPAAAPGMRLAELAKPHEPRRPAGRSHDRTGHSLQPKPAGVRKLCRSSCRAVSTLGKAVKVLSRDNMSRRIILLGVDALGCGNAAKRPEPFRGRSPISAQLSAKGNIFSPVKRTSTTLSAWHFPGTSADEAQAIWRRAAGRRGDTDMFAYYRALALRSLGDDAGSRALLRRLHAFAGDECLPR